jgi:hypothetical protein
VEQVDSDQRANWDQIGEHWVLTRDGSPVAVVYEIPGHRRNGEPVWTCKFKRGNLLVEVPTRQDAMRLAEEWTLVQSYLAEPKD